METTCLALQRVSFFLYVAQCLETLPNPIRLRDFYGTSMCPKLWVGLTVCYRSILRICLCIDGARARGGGDVGMASFGRLISTVDPPNPIPHIAGAGKANTNPLSYVTGLCLGHRLKHDRI